MKNLKICDIDTYFDKHIKLKIYPTGRNKIEISKGRNEILSPRITFEEEYFGFKLLFQGKHSPITYRTNETITRIEETNDDIRIYEGHKFLPWVFTRKGELLEIAQFLADSKDDYKHLEEIGINNKEEIQIWNELYQQKIRHELEKVKKHEMNRAKI